MTASFDRTSDWGTGYVAAYRVTNSTGAAVTGWTLEFDLPSTATVSGLWNGVLLRTGTHYRVDNASWTATVPAGGSVTVGFEGTSSGVSVAPQNCRINGSPCAAGGTAPAPGGPGTPTSTTPPATSSTAVPPAPATQVVAGYFVEWGVYGRNFHVKNLQASGAAGKLTHILYAFGNVTDGRCAIGDSYAAYDRAYTAADSVDGVADSWDSGTLRGNFGQLRRLKRLHPNLKVIWSFGGWTWSGGFGQAAANPANFANSCFDLVEDPRWADVFDGIDIDWEYPNACGVVCDTGGAARYRNLMAALRARFGTALVTSAITADGSAGGKLEAADYAGAAPYVDWFMPMTYDYFGAWNPAGPTAPHSPLTSYQGIPVSGFSADAAMQRLIGKGVPAGKLLLGIGFYGRGWKGVTQNEPGGTATGAAPATYEAGVEDYRVLKDRCPPTGTVAGTAYARCGDEWWSYDTPATIAGKLSYVTTQGLGGAFVWELSGDTPEGELVSAVHAGMSR